MKKLAYQDDPSFPLYREPRPGRVGETEKARLTLAKSWFEVKRTAGGYEITEHRVGERAETRIHSCSTPGEAHRLKAQLARDGLIGIGEAI